MTPLILDFRAMYYEVRKCLEQCRCEYHWTRAGYVPKTQCRRCELVERHDSMPGVKPVEVKP